MGKKFCLSMQPRNCNGHVTVLRPGLSHHRELFSWCGSLQSVLELIDGRPYYGHLTLTAVRVSDDQYHMTLSRAQFSVN